MPLAALRSLLAVTLIAVATTNTGPVSLAQVSALNVKAFRPPPAILSGYIINDVFIDFRGQYVGSQLTVELEAGSIYQDPANRNTPPFSEVVAVIPSVAFDSFLALGSPTSDGSSSQMPSVQDRCNFGPCFPPPQFNSDGIHIGWHPAGGVVIFDRSDFLVARLTFSEEARGTFRYVGSAGGVIFEAPELTLQNGIIQGATLLPDVTGDYNFNGLVEQGDLDLVLLNWSADAIPPPQRWRNGLPTGLVDQDELDKVLLNWGNSAALGNVASVVPEPSSIVLLFIAAAVLSARFRRRTEGQHCRLRIATCLFRLRR